MPFRRSPDVSRPTPLRNARFQVMLGALRFDLLRLAGVSVMATVGLLAVAWFYPVQLELDTAEYRYATWDVSTEIEVFAEDVPRVQHDFGADNVFLAGYWTTGLSHGSHEVAADVLVTLTPNVSLSLGPFPPSAMISSVQVGENWVDLDALTARRLGVGSGDDVELRLAEGVAAGYRVRGVYGVSPLQGYNPSAVASGTPIMAEFTEGLSAVSGERGVMSLALVRGMGISETREVLSGSFYRGRLEAGGYDPDNIEMVTPGERLAHATANSDASLGLIQGVSIVAALALLGLLLRETWQFSVTSARRARLVVLVGAPVRQIARLIGISCGAVVAVAMAVGAALTVQVLGNGLLVVSFPPTLLGTFWLVNSLAALFLGGLSAAVSRRMLSRRAGGEDQ